MENSPKYVIAWHPKYMPPTPLYTLNWINSGEAVAVTCKIATNVTLRQAFSTHYVRLSQLPDFSIAGKLAWNGLQIQSSKHKA